MGMKDKVVLVVGIIAVLVISALIINANSELLRDQAKASIAAEGVLVQQKNIAIAKLVQKLRMKEAELVGMKTQLASAKAKFDADKAEFEGTKKKLDNIRAELNAPVETPAKPKK